MSFMKCKVCIEKDIRIADLKSQIEYFKEQLHPKPVVRTYQLEEETEANNVLDGAGKETIDLDAERKENERIQRENDFIFSGNDEPIDPTILN